MEWIKKIAPIAGYIIGLVLVAIGAVMTLQSGMNLAFAEPNSYYYEDICENNIRYNALDAKESIEKITPEERDDCLKRQEEREQKQFKNRNVQSLINGLSLLIVGGFFWGLFRERKGK